MKDWFFSCLCGSLLYYAFKGIDAGEAVTRVVVITLTMLTAWGILSLCWRIEIRWKKRPHRQGEKQ